MTIPALSSKNQQPLTLNPQNLPVLMTVKQAATYLNLHYLTVLKRIKRKETPAIWWQGCWVVRRDDLSTLGSLPEANVPAQRP